MTARTLLPVALVMAAGIAALGPALWANGRGPRPVQLRSFQTPYYVLNTDLGEADAREADLRLTRMFEEYQRRTAGFAGQIRTKFPFFLYRNDADYYAAGAPPKSAGVFIFGPNGGRLMAIAGEHTSAGTWHVVQHEGFHQFVAASIRYELPIWANEGLAEYFGEGIWTGDGFVTGLIPPHRLDEVKDAIRENRFKSFAQLLAMTDKEWGDKLEYSNYTEAWAMIHFLAHADNGKYQGPFLQFMKQVSTGTPAVFAWNNVFGKDTTAFEKRFAEWWLNLPENPTRDGYLQAVVQTQTSFLARAYLQKQSFPDADTFFKEFKPAALTVNRDLWLPPSLFEETRDAALKVGTWSIESAANQLPHLICEERDGTKLIGTFAINSGKVAKVAVQTIPAPEMHAAPAP
jgi:uncharacterized protein DUF1570